MSGFDVVGVELGAIPLIISALKKYKNTSRRLRYARQKEELVNELTRSLNEQHCFVKGDLYLILKGAFLEDDKIDRFLNQPDSSLNELFNNQALVQEVEECLGDWYTPYITALGRCTTMLMAIAKSLTGLYSDSQAGLSTLIKANPPKNGLYEFGRRINSVWQKMTWSFKSMN
ncbi:hypothetical protein N7478_002208 [Penicillium angulare]|uniref:uncharacterized protein n=1 Tax=Penicillium angulare TaxID=116970 RepID=UPI00253FF969|nr:uncharacterized protein N7478_002208 [Penicillium angulare]KAJ5289178.1 hypothetical protein N7478_002208 [Penicillium angulare]